nr:hypothetical protein [Fredinandcohnia onubensis]
MKLKNVNIKRLSLYIIGLFFLSLGVSFSIQVDLGVSPVSSLAYAFALASGLSVGMMTIVTIQSLGAVGIGTVVTAYFIGKILGWFMKYFQQPLSQWMNKNKINEAVKKKNTSLSS